MLFRIDPKPYEYVVQQKRASLAEAEQAVGQLKASLDQTTAGMERARVQLQLAEQNHERQVQLFDKKVIAQATLDTAQRNLDAAKQTFAESVAVEERARVAFGSTIDGVNTTVARIRAELGDAMYDPEQTTVRAPGPGFVTQVFLRPGLYVLPNPLRPAMVFVNTASGDRALTAAFQQNTLQRVRAGDEAEVAFDAVPGRVFKGKVRLVFDAIGAGQFQATGALIDVGGRTPGGRALAVIELDDSLDGYQVPLGSAGVAAVYTDHWHHVAIMRKILLRMQSWQNYIYFEGH